MSDAVAAIGASITIGGVPIEEVRDITGPELTTDIVDVTNHSSPDFSEEKLPTLKRFGNISFAMNAVPGATGQQALYDAWVDRSAEPFVYTQTNGVVYTFDGYCTSFSPSASVTDINMLDVAITPASAPVITGWGS